MYNEDVTRIPLNDDEMWDVLAEQLSFVEDVLQHTPVETPDEARVPRAERDQWRISYRGTSKGVDNREYYLHMGRELITSVSKGITERQMTAAFVQQWGMLMFCHGFIAAYVLDDSDSMVRQRGGRKRGEQVSVARQKVWFAHHVVPLMHDHNLKYTHARKVVERYISDLLDAEQLPYGFPPRFLDDMLSDGVLKSTYESDLPKWELDQLYEEPTLGLPPIRRLTPVS